MLKQAGKVLGWKEKEDMEGDPLIFIRFSPDHSPEGLGFFLELEDAGDDLGFVNFPPAFLRGVSAQGVHLAETATIPGYVIFSNKDPDTRDEEALMPIRCRPDFFHVADGFFIQRPVGKEYASGKDSIRQIGADKSVLMATTRSPGAKVSMVCRW